MATEKTSLVHIEDVEFSKQTSSWFGLSLIMANIVLGSGLLNFPSAYNDAGGILSALLIEFFALILVQMGIVLIAYCSDIVRKDSYQDVVEEFTGKFGLFWCNVFIVVHDFGACVTFLVIIADQMDQVMLWGFGPSFCHTWYMNRTFTMTVVSIVLILPFCFPKDISSFKFASFIGILTTVYLFILIIYKYASSREDPNLEDVEILTQPRTWSDVFKVIPTVVFSFEAHIEGVPLYASLRKRDLNELGRTLLSSTIICVIVYNMVGIFGYLTFGQFVKSDILAAYYPIDIPVIIGMAMVALKSVMTYPVVFFCARLVLIDVFGDRVCGKSEPRQRYIITVILFAISIVIALSVPTIGSIISLLGGSAALFIFVFPGICFMQAHLYAVTTIDKAKRLAAFFYVVFGTFLIGTTTTQAITSFTSGGLVNEVQCI